MLAFIYLLTGSYCQIWVLKHHDPTPQFSEKLDLELNKVFSFILKALFGIQDHKEKQNVEEPQYEIFKQNSKNNIQIFV